MRFIDNGNDSTTMVHNNVSVILNFKKSKILEEIKDIVKHIEEYGINWWECPSENHIFRVSCKSKMVAIKYIVIKYSRDENKNVKKEIITKKVFHLTPNEFILSYLLSFLLLKGRGGRKRNIKKIDFLLYQFIFLFLLYKKDDAICKQWS